MTDRCFFCAAYLLVYVCTLRAHCVHTRAHPLTLLGARRWIRNHYYPFDEADAVCLSTRLLFIISCDSCRNVNYLHQSLSVRWLLHCVIIRITDDLLHCTLSQYGNPCRWTHSHYGSQSVWLQSWHYFAFILFAYHLTFYQEITGFWKSLCDSISILWPFHTKSAQLLPGRFT